MDPRFESWRPRDVFTYSMKTAKCIISVQKIGLSVLLAFLVYLSFWSVANSDTGYYVVPVQITKTDSTIELGFLSLFVNKIVGVEERTNMKTEVNIQGEKESFFTTLIKPITKGRIHPETLRIDTVKMVSVGYDFGEIEILEITEKGLRIRMVSQNFSLELKEVTHFLFDGGQTLPLSTHVWTSHTDFFYRDQKIQIPLKEVKKIKTVGKVLQIPANWGD